MLRGDKYRAAFLEDMAAASLVVAEARGELQVLLDKDEALPLNFNLTLKLVFLKLQLARI